MTSRPVGISLLMLTLLVSICCMSHTSCHAQASPLFFSPRTQNLGISIYGFNTSPIYGYATQYLLRYGYNAKQQLQVGLETMYHNRGLTGQEISGGPFGRYHFTERRLSPWVESDYKLLRFVPRTDDLPSRSFRHRVSASLGAGYYGIKKRFGVEVFGTLTYASPDDVFGWVGYRISYYFKRK